MDAIPFADAAVSSRPRQRLLPPTDGPRPNDPLRNCELRRPREKPLPRWRRRDAIEVHQRERLMCSSGDVNGMPIERSAEINRPNFDNIIQTNEAVHVVI